MSPKLYLLIVYSWVIVGGTCFAQTKQTKLEVDVYDTPSCFCSLTITTTLLQNASSCDVNDGALDISVSGGSGDFSFKWTDQSGAILSTSEDIQNLYPGFYFLNITDANNSACTALRYYEIASDIKINSTASLNTNCVNPNGAINLSVTGGSGSFSYDWTYPDGSVSKIKNITGLKAGQYTVKVTDLVKGCSVTKTISVRNLYNLTVSILNITPNTSCQNTNGGADIQVTGGSGQYTYYWYHVKKGAYVSYQEDLANANGGEYSIYVIDNLSGCVAYQFLEIPDQTVKPDFTIQATANTRCAPPFNGALLLEPIGTPGPYSISWTDGASAVSDQLHATGLPSGKYGFILTDLTTGCSTAQSVQSSAPIIVQDESTPAISVNVDEIVNNTNCAAPNGEIQITIEAASDLFEIAWTGPNNFSSPSEDITGLSQGKYILTVSVSCNQPPVIEPPILAFVTGQSSRANISLNLEDFISDPDNNLDLSSVEILDQPLSKAKATITSEYFLDINYSGITFKGTDALTLKACDELGACTEEKLNIDIDVKGDVIVYNAVSPTSGGDNKFMRIYNLPIDIGNKVMIYNRWGDVVFHIENYDNETGGKRFEGVSDHGKELPTGTYFYKIEFADGRKTLTGYLALKR